MGFQIVTTFGVTLYIFLEARLGRSELFPLPSPGPRTRRSKHRTRSCCAQMSAEAQPLLPHDRIAFPLICRRRIDRAFFFALALFAHRRSSPPAWPRPTPNPDTRSKAFSAILGFTNTSIARSQKGGWARGLPPAFPQTHKRPSVALHTVDAPNVCESF